MKPPAFRVVITALLTAILGTGALTGCDAYLPQLPERPQQNSDSNSAATSDDASPQLSGNVVRVVDGDTIVVTLTEDSASAYLTQAAQPNKSGEHTVRILGIDAPEMNHKDKAAGPDCGAKEATDLLAQTLPAHTAVMLTFDAQADHVDRYGRLLVYVTAPTGADVGFTLVSAGWASPWYPRGEPEPERTPLYTTAATAAAEQALGGYGSCHSLGRG